jgi:hypothetical protein
VGNDTAPSGYYLRTDASGNIRFSNLDINNQFTAYSTDIIGNSYPLNVVSTAQGADGSFITNFGFTKRNSNGSQFTDKDDGAYVAYNGYAWVTASGLKAYQTQVETSNPQSCPGIAFGYKPSVTSTYNSHSFAGGSFNHNDVNRVYDGSSQYVQYYLRTRTTGPNGVGNPLVTNWSKSSVISDETSNNCINFNDFYSLSSAQYDRVWGYKISVSVLWQSGVQGGPQGPRKFAGTYEIEGGVYRSAAGTEFYKFGNEDVRYYGDTMPSVMSLSTEIRNTSSIPRLSIVASGGGGWTALWSATARVNQLNHPGANPLYGSV